MCVAYGSYLYKFSSVKVNESTFQFNKEEKEAGLYQLRLLKFFALIMLLLLY